MKKIISTLMGCSILMLNTPAYGGLYNSPVVIDPTSQLMTNAWSEAFLNGMITTCTDILTANGRVRDEKLGAKLVRERIAKLYSIIGSTSQGFRLKQPWSRESFMEIGDKLIDHCRKNPHDNALTAALTLMNNGAGNALKPNNRSEMFDSPRREVFNGNPNNWQSSDIWRRNDGASLDSWSENTNSHSTQGPGRRSGPLMLE